MGITPQFSVFMSSTVCKPHSRGVNMTLGIFVVYFLCLPALSAWSVMIVNRYTMGAFVYGRLAIQ